MKMIERSNCWQKKDLHCIKVPKTTTEDQAALWFYTMNNIDRYHSHKEALFDL